MKDLRRVSSLLILLFVFICSVPSLQALPSERFGENWKLTVSPEIRLSYHNAKNTGYLNNQVGDSLEYGSYIYQLPIALQYGTVLNFFAKLTGEGPSHYAAPFKDVTTVTEGSNVQKNGSGNSFFYPYLSEAWIRFSPTPTHSIQVGQSPYVVGNGYALGGQYNNYGVTVQYEKGSSRIRFRYSLLDVENAYSELRRNTQTKYLGRDADSDAYMVATDILMTPYRNELFSLTFQPYGGLLHDQTPPEKRKQYGYFSNALGFFQAKLDEIFTYGLSSTLDSPYITFNVEYAQNAGTTYSEPNNQNWGDITHTGYLVHYELKAHMGILTPRAKIVYASGNQANPSDRAGYLSGTLKRNQNNAFTVFSPLNSNLVDSFAHLAPVPVVAMAGGYTLNYGIRRPGTYNDPHVWENLNAYDIGLTVVPSPKFFVLSDLWILKQRNPAVGVDSTGTLQYLSMDLGTEIDYMASYSVTRSCSVGIHGGYFMPGDYYKTVRFDPSFNWNNSISQTVRTDGMVDPAYQVELFTTYKF